MVMKHMKTDLKPDRYREGATQDERLLERVEDLQAMGMDAGRIFSQQEIKIAMDRRQQESHPKRQWKPQKYAGLNKFEEI